MFKTLHTLIAWKDLLWTLVLKNLRLPYRHTRLGFVWAFLFPLALSGIYYFVFSRLLRMEIEGVPFFLYLLSGIFPWQFFQISVSQGARSLLDNKHLLRESQVPHPLVPLAIVLANAILFLPALILMVIAGMCIGGSSGYLFLLPWCLAMLVFLTAGSAILASMGSLAWRDLPYALDLGMTFLFYWTPIVYPMRLALEALSAPLSLFYVWNPFFGMMAIFRLALIAGFEAHIPEPISAMFLMGIVSVTSMGLFFAALVAYQKCKPWLNDALSY